MEIPAGSPPVPSVRDGDISVDLYNAALEAGVAACDTETTGLDPSKDHLRVVQVHVPGCGTEVVRVDASEPKYLADLLSSATVLKLFHHATFDLQFLSQKVLAPATSVACTKVAAKLLWPNDREEQRLTGLTRRYLGLTLDKSQQVSDWSAISLSDAQVAYAAADVEHLPALFRHVCRDLADAGLLGLAEGCWAHLPIRAQLDLGGFGDVFAY